MGGDTRTSTTQQPEGEGLGDALMRLFRTTMSGSEPYENLETPPWGLKDLPHKEMYTQEENISGVGDLAGLMALQRAFQSGFERTFHSGPGFVTGQEFDTPEMRAAAAAARAKTASSMRSVDIPSDLQLAYDPRLIESPIRGFDYQSDLYRHLLDPLNRLLGGDY